MFKSSQHVLVSLVLFLGLASCQKKAEVPKPEPAMATLISAFSAGTLSADGPIRVQWVNPAVDSQAINRVLDKSPFDFSPSIPGSAVWVDPHTLEFRPSKRLERGETYHAKLHVDRIMEVPEKLRVFEFSFTPMKQFYERDISGLQTMDENHLELQKVSGILRLADGEDANVVEKMLTAKQDGQSLFVRWEHRFDRREHLFHVDSLKRGEDSSRLVLAWDGALVGAENNAYDTVKIPSIHEFKVVSVEPGLGDERYVSVHFSDPPKKGMEFRGLIEVAEQEGLRFEAVGNEVRVYSGNAWHGSKTVQIFAGIKNVFGKTLQNPGSHRVTFEEMKPGVRFVGKGVILPAGGDLTLPFEAVNLRAVRVNVVRVYAGNLPQFLQVNDLEGDQEMQRVGRSVWSKTVELNPTASIRQRWARYALDLGDLVKKNEPPGSLYRITLSFSRPNSLYPCEDSAAIAAEEELAEKDWDDNNQTQSSSWDGAEQYYSDYGNYEWDQRDNPCSKSYYMVSERKSSRNFLPSDLGLMAKSGRPGQWLVVATDLNTSEPMADVELRLLNFQQQVMVEGKTDGNGFAELEPSGRPYLVMASKGNQRGYLKLDENAAMQMGQFDVGGLSVKEGLKGFLFGERGVWRPGDSLYLTFILEDKKGRLPNGHPVSFELLDPQGRVVRTLTRASAGSFYAFHTFTDPDAPTGDYLARVKAGPAVFEERLKIENVMPNRLKIKVDFASKTLKKGAPVAGNLNVTWLTGAVARHLEADVEMSLQAVNPDFKIFTDHEFTDPVRRFETETQFLFKGRIDAEGKAAFSHPLEVSGKAPGILRANFKTRVLEEGGGFSVDRFSQPLYPYDVFVGVKLPPGDKARGMLLTDTVHPVNICVLDPEGRKVPTRKLEVRLHKLEWRWWWDKGEQEAHYLSEQGGNLLQTDIVTTKNGEAVWGLKVRYPDWGRYLVRVCDIGDGGNKEGKDAGHCTGKIFYMDWPGWAGRGQRDGQGGGAAVLSFSADKKKYAVGEKARITIPSPNQGRAWVSIEKGSQVLRHYWVDLKPKETQHDIEITSDMAPNVYVYVALLQPHRQTANDLPMRMYNVIPIQVEDPATRLQPELSVAPQVFRPGEKAEIAVSESAGKAMQYVVAAVDEGLLDLTRFKTPDPWEHFYAREALGIKTWDLYDFVAGAYGGRLERLLAIGGDGAFNAPEGRKGNRFPPMVRFMGPFTLEKGKRAKHAFQVPQYVGSVRVMVIAAGSGAYGFAEKPVPVRKPLMVLGTLPRILGPDENFELPISVFAMEKHVRDVNVEVTVSGPLLLEGSSKRKMVFREPSDELVTFQLRSKDRTGWAKVVIRATSGGEKAEQTLEIQVRNPNPMVTDVHQAVLQPGLSWNHEFKLPGVAGSNQAVLELSRIPPLNLEKRLRFLVQYPYGCVEQTTSSVFPQLFLGDLMDLSASAKTETEKNIKAGIDRLRGFQVASGGFGYWPGNGDVNAWGTTYAGHFLIESEKRGYGLPAGMLDQWKKHQKSQAQGWNDPGREDERLIQAYRLYTLALAGAAEMGAMNRLKEAQKLPEVALAHLAGAYHLAGQKEIAASLMRNVPNKVKAYSEADATFGSELRDMSILMEMDALMGRHDQAAAWMKEISAGLADEKWHSTQTTAYALLAIARFMGQAQSKSIDTPFQLKVNGLASDGKFSASLMQKDLAIKDGQANQLALVNRSKGLIYARLLVKGQPPMGQGEATANGIQLAIAYLDLQGNPIGPESLEQGTDFMAEFTVQHAGRRVAYKQLALASHFPSGWEIRNTRMDPSENATKVKSRTRNSSSSSSAATLTSVPDYQDFRDDRVYTFFDLKAGESKRFRFYLHAAYLGRFHLPQSLVEAMYDGAIQSRTQGGTAIVKVSEGSDGDPDAPSMLQRSNDGSDEGTSEEGGEEQGDASGDDSGGSQEEDASGE
jgi:alpha-2-macroglobulin